MLYSFKIQTPIFQRPSLPLDISILADLMLVSRAGSTELDSRGAYESLIWTAVISLCFIAAQPSPVRQRRCLVATARMGLQVVRKALTIEPMGCLYQ